MNDSNKNVSTDGRITVLFFLMLSLLLFDVVYRHSPSFLKKNTACQQLRFVTPNKLVVENCGATAQERGIETAPARYSPYFYAAIPINRSNKDILMTVQGIGPQLAEDIVTYRHRFGPFTSSKDLLNLPGIGPKRAAKFATVFTFAETQ